MQPIDNRRMPPIELLAPAGNFEKLEFVLHYGADAVYLAGEDFSLRNFADNFTLDQMEAAIGLAHDHGAKVYVAVNIFARNKDIKPLETHIPRIRRLGPDGIIAADPAVIALCRSLAPELPVHLSTQANTTNLAAARFWQAQGVRRVNLARELSLVEIKTIAAGTRLDIEVFAHGAMCISYSGRCLLSNFMAQRPSNQGRCCQPCRFQYTVMESTRPGQYYPLAEDRQGTYVFNSRDLCMLYHLPDIVQAGVRSVKIEGRMKGIHYAATSVNIYRQAIDRYYQAPDQYEAQPHWQEELDKITIRGYCTGFYFNDPGQTVPHYSAPRAGDYQLVGNVVARGSEGKTLVEVRNRIQKGDRLEWMTKAQPPRPVTVRRIEDDQAGLQDVVQPGQRVWIDLGTPCRKFDLLRKRAGNETVGNPPVAL